MASLSFVLAMGCPPPPDPVYDEELDLQAASIEPGALAGSFALFTRAVGDISTPLGPTPSGNDDWLLIEREWDPAAGDSGAYHQVTQLCGGEYIPVLETLTVIPTETWRAVRASTEEVVVVDHALGTYDVADHLQMWALDGFDDPLHDALPLTRDEIDGTSFVDDHVYDADGDGQVGATFFTEGLVNGEVYAAQRKTTNLEGLVLSADHLAGRSSHLYEFLVIAASISLLETQPQVNPTDRAQSWFEEVRLPAGADCDDVQALVDDDTLGDRPF